MMLTITGNHHVISDGYIRGLAQDRLGNGVTAVLPWAIDMMLDYKSTTYIQAELDSLICDFISDCSLPDSCDPKANTRQIPQSSSIKLYIYIYGLNKF